MRAFVWQAVCRHHAYGNMGGARLAMPCDRCMMRTDVAKTTKIFLNSQYESQPETEPTPVHHEIREKSQGRVQRDGRSQK